MSDVGNVSGSGNGIKIRNICERERTTRTICAGWVKGLSIITRTESDPNWPSFCYPEEQATTAWGQRNNTYLTAHITIKITAHIPTSTLFCESQLHGQLGLITHSPSRNHNRGA